MIAKRSCLGFVIKDEGSPLMPERTDEPVSFRMEPELNILRPQLTDEQWLLISDFFPVPERDSRSGRPRTDAR